MEEEVERRGLPLPASILGVRILAWNHLSPVISL